MSNQDSYTPGQCTWGVAGAAPWIPPGLGDASQWLANAQAKGLPTGSAPRLGAVVTWGANAGVDQIGGAGHTALVTGFGPTGLPIISEMNFDGNGGGPFKWDQRQLTAAEAAAVAGYIYPPGSASTPIAATTTGAQLTGSHWWDGIPVVGQIGGAVNFGTWLVTTVTDPATYFTLAWLALSLVVGLAGFRAILSGEAPSVTGAARSVAGVIPI